MKMITLLATFVLSATAGESSAMSDTEMYLQVRDAAKNWKSLSRILITPLVHEGGKSISTSGFGVIEGEELSKFVQVFGEGTKEPLPGYSDGVKVRLYFLHKDRGFAESNSWVCWLNRGEVVGVFAVDGGRINVRFPQAAADLILGKFVKEVE